MSVTIRPPMVSALGDAARDIGDSALGGLAGGLAGGQGDVEAAGIQDLSAYQVLTQVLSTWEWSGRNAAQTVTSVGNKLRVTASTHGRTDGVSAELFRHGAVTVY